MFNIAVETVSFTTHEEARRVWHFMMHMLSWDGQDPRNRLDNNNKELNDQVLFAFTADSLD